MLLAQAAGDGHQRFHRVVGRPDDAGGEEQPLNIVAAIEAERQVDHFPHGEAGAPHIARPAVDAIMAVEDAAVGQQDLAQRRSAEHTSELQSLLRNSYAVFSLKKKTNKHNRRDLYYKHT